MHLSFSDSPAPDAQTRVPPRAPRGRRVVSSTAVTLGFVLLDGLCQGASALVRIAGGYAADRIGEGLPDTDADADAQHPGATDP